MSHFNITKITFDAVRRYFNVQVGEWADEASFINGVDPFALRELYLSASDHGHVSLDSIEAAFSSLNWSTFPAGDRVYVDGNGQAHSYASRPGEHLAWSFDTQGWVNSLTTDDQWAKVRAERDKALKASDWLSIRAADTGVPLPQPWAAYRQALRDITLQSDPFSIVWPVAP